MTYAAIAAIASDLDIMARLTACVAQEDPAPPQTTAAKIIWPCAAEPGWAEAYASAIASDNPRPGLDPAVIPDAWILSAAQKHMGTT